MIDRKTPKQPQSKTVVAPKSPRGNVVTTPDTFASQDRIRARAYELYERRSRGPSQEKQDWLRAEEEILTRER